MAYKTFTSESVGIGHPDKICDQIADRILEYAINKSPSDNPPRMAIEVFANSKAIVVGGESSIKIDKSDVERCVFSVLTKTGILKEFKEKKLKIINMITLQSEEIANAVVKDNKEIGAGDQGSVFGYATTETVSFLPLSVHLSQKIVDEFCWEGKINDWKELFSNLRSDMKSQVTVSKHDDGSYTIDRVLFSVQHWKELTDADRKNIIIKIKKVLNYEIEIHKNDTIIKYSDNLIISVNPSGSFIKGSIFADTGLTGRKLACDTYGGYARHGGGALSGKDMTKVDRSGAYFARWLAKNMVFGNRFGIDAIEIQLSYEIGNPYPTSVSIDDRSMSHMTIYEYENINNFVKEMVNIPLKEIINVFTKDYIGYEYLSEGNHFDHVVGTPWNRLIDLNNPKNSLEKRFVELFKKYYGKE